MKRIALVLGIGLLTVATAAIYAEARTNADAGVTLTGCLNSGGELKSVALGANPTKPCGSNETLVHLGDGDITGVAAGTGLVGGADHGEASLAIAPAFRLPQNCTAGQAPQLGTGAAWGCATYAAADQSCPSGQFVNGVNGDGKVTCANALTGLEIKQLAVGDANCATGGISVALSGSTQYVCNGAQGPQGNQGPAGPAGPQGPAGGLSDASSSNGDFGVEVTNLGVYIHGPTGTFVVGTNGSFFSPDPYYGR
jgi:hypothetical protein